MSELESWCTVTPRQLTNSKKLTFRNLQQWITNQCKVKILYTLSLSMQNKGIVIILRVLWALKRNSDGIKLSTGILLSVTAVYDVQLIHHCWTRRIRHEVRTVHYALFREDYLPVYSAVWPHCGVDRSDFSVVLFSDTVLSDMILVMLLLPDYTFYICLFICF